MATLNRRTLLRGLAGCGAMSATAACGGLRSATGPAGPASGAGLASTADVSAELNDLSSLRAHPPIDGVVVRVAGHTLPGDGGGGVFTWVPGANFADDDGIYVASQLIAEGRWVRDYGDERLNAKWFGANGDGARNDGPALERAMACAAAMSTPLVIPSGRYLVTSNVNAEVAAGEELRVMGEGATIVRTGGDGRLRFDAPLVTTARLAQTVAQGDTQVVVDDPGGVAPGDIMEIMTGIRVSSVRESSWTMTWFGTVTAVNGNRITLDGPSDYRFHPFRRLTYRMDGNTRDVVYRIFFGGEERDVVVKLDGRTLRAGADYAISGNPVSGYDISLNAAPPAGAMLSLETRESIAARFFRGGRLHVSGLKFESDFLVAGGVTYVDSRGLAPRGARFSDIEMHEANPPHYPQTGYPSGQSFDLFDAGLIEGLVENVTVYGGRYAVKAGKGRKTVYRNIVGRKCWAVFASFSAADNHVRSLKAIDCTLAADSHYAHRQFVDGVESVNGYDGMNHRANGGVLRNVQVVNTRSPGSPGLPFGVSQGSPLYDHLIADPQDNPFFMYVHAENGIANDMLIENARFSAPGDGEGYGLSGTLLHRLTLRDVDTDGYFSIDGNGPPPIRHLDIDGFTCRAANLRGITDTISARGLVCGRIRLSGSSAGIDGQGAITFADCTIDGAMAGRDGLLEDDGPNGHGERHFTDCRFVNAERLFVPGAWANASHNTRRYVFERCHFDLSAASADDAYPAPASENGALVFRDCTFAGVAPPTG